MLNPWNRGWLKEVELDVIMAGCLVSSFPVFSADTEDVGVTLSLLVMEISPLLIKTK